MKCWSIILKTKKCPICRGVVSAKNLETDELKEEIILQLSASCKNRGCDWKGTFANFILMHIDKCDQD